MSYFNYEMAEKRGIIHTLDLPLLQSISQNTKGSCEQYVDEAIDNAGEDRLAHLEEIGMIKYVKSSPRGTKASRVRLSNKGVKIMASLTKRGPAPDEEDEVLANWMHGIYSRRSNYVKANMAEVKRLIAWFKDTTTIDGKKLAMLLKCFMEDTFLFDDTDTSKTFWDQFNEYKRQNPRAVISNKIENVFWKPPGIFAKKYNLNESPLWEYYETNQGHIHKKWSSM